MGSDRIREFVSESSDQLHLSHTYDLGGQFMTIDVRDWNGDRSPDLLVRTVQNYSLVILYNRGDETFEPQLDCGLYIPVFTANLWEDFNHDGWMDIAQTSENGNRIGVALGIDGCSFAPFSYYGAPGDRAEALRAADMNGDGQLDLITIGSVGQGINPPSDRLLAVLLGKPDSTFTPNKEVVSIGSVGSNAIDITDLAIGEVTGDQRPDIVFTFNDGQIKTWKNTCQ